MKKRTHVQLDAALKALLNDLAPRVDALASKCADGAATPEELREYAAAVRLNDTLSLVRLQAEDLLATRTPS